MVSATNFGYKRTTHLRAESPSPFLSLPDTLDSHLPSLSLPSSVLRKWPHTPAVLTLVQQLTLTQMGHPMKMSLISRVRITHIHRPNMMLWTRIPLICHSLVSVQVSLKLFTVRPITHDDKHVGNIPSLQAIPLLAHQ